MGRLAAKLGISIWISLILGLTTARLALAQAIDQPPLSGIPLAASSLSTSLIYARVLTGNVPVYQHPLHATTGISPVRLLDPGYVWVTLADIQPFQVDHTQWYLINQDEYVQADYLQIFQPSAFHGLERPSSEIFAWIVFDTWTATAPGVLPGNDSVLLKRYTIVSILDEQLFEDRIWYQVDEQHWVEQGMVGIIEPKPRPEGIPPGDKWIEIDLYEQTLAAYEGDEIVYATLVSSGLPYWQTQSGLFQIWVKVKQAKMSGRDGYPDYYFLEDVPWSMYFNHNYALHGAYWHDRFGIRHSHGCVNISLTDAKWLFDWTTPVGKTGWTRADEKNVGTWVWVHE